MSDSPEPSQPPSPSAARRNPAGYAVLGLAVVAALAVGIYLFVSGGDDRDGPEPAATIPGLSGVPNPYPNTGPLDPNRPVIGQTAPNFALVDARDTSVVRELKDYRGKAVVINWYASWCSPCKAEIPDFLKAQAALGDQVVFLGVNLLETQDKAVRIHDELGAGYPAVLDASGSVADHYRVAGMPSTFFVDKDGVLRAMKTGRVTEQELGEFLTKAGVPYSP
jgi:thiol-disulfide isomerase/thioredoxin